jgi:hypothetical protein
LLKRIPLSEPENLFSAGRLPLPEEVHPLSSSNVDESLFRGVEID